MGNQRSIGRSSTDPFNCDGLYLRTLSRSCLRRFQVKADHLSFSRTESNGTETADVANDERDLIHNIYLTRRVSAITSLQG